MSAIVTNKIKNGLERFIDTIFVRSPLPHTDVGIYERDGCLFVEIYAPQLNPDSIEIYSSRWYLMIQGTVGVHNIPFKQTIRLPKKVKKNEVFATCSKGILEVTLPKL